MAAVPWIAASSPASCQHPEIVAGNVRGFGHELPLERHLGLDLKLIGVEQARVIPETVDRSEPQRLHERLLLCLAVMGKGCHTWSCGRW